MNDSQISELARRLFDIILDEHISQNYDTEMRQDDEIIQTDGT